VVPEVVPEVVPDVVPLVVPEVVPEVEPEVLPDVEPEVLLPSVEVPEVLPEVVPEPVFSEAVQAVNTVSDEHSTKPVSDEMNLRFIRVWKCGKEGKEP